jgi:GTPase SAR1 family protein
MADNEQLSGKLLAQYEAIRRQEHEEITALLESLGRVDSLPENEMEQVRDALFHTNHPFLMVMVGPFGSGKSSMINALLGEEVLDVGPIPTTDHIVILRRGSDVQRSRAGDIETVFHPNPILENLSLVDTPGLESIFRTHDEVTRRFLHRADVVVLVMIATQVLTASNLEYLQQLKVFGKRVIVAVNQVDVLEPAERDQVRDFVIEQSRQHLGVEPLVWLVSAREALEAQQETPRDEILWDESGFADIEAYIKETLGNVERFRQKLETPVQVCQNVTESALALVQEQQAALDAHRKTVENIDAQIEQGRREQQKTIDDALTSIENIWNEASARGSGAIGDLFQFSRGIGLFFGGLGEIAGIGRLMRRFQGRTRAETAFEQHKVLETLRQIPEAVDKLGPRLEGRDLQDIDDLVDYTRSAVQELPTTLSGKVIGKIQSPLHYERSFLRDIRGKLDDILRDAERFETSHLDRTLRNTLIILALWEIMTVCLVLAVAAGGFGGVSTKLGSVFVIFAVGIVMVIVGLALVPLRGWFVRANYERRLRHQRNEYLDILRRAAQEMTAHGVQLRRDATAPMTRLVESQGELLGTLRTDLLVHQQTLTRIQGGLADLAPKSDRVTKEQA